MIPTSHRREMRRERKRIDIVHVFVRCWKTWVGHLSLVFSMADIREARGAAISQ